MEACTDRPSHLEKKIGISLNHSLHPFLPHGPLQQNKRSKLAPSLFLYFSVDSRIFWLCFQHLYLVNSSCFLSSFSSFHSDSLVSIQHPSFKSKAAKISLSSSLFRSFQRKRRVSLLSLSRLTSRIPNGKKKKKKKKKAVMMPI